MENVVAYRLCSVGCMTDCQSCGPFIRTYSFPWISNNVRLPDELPQSEFWSIKFHLKIDQNEHTVIRKIHSEILKKLPSVNEVKKELSVFMIYISYIYAKYDLWQVRRHFISSRLFLYVLFWCCLLYCDF